MPGQTLSSGSLGSCAIAGGRLAAPASTRAAVATDKVFISDLIQFEARVVRACRPRWSGSPFEVGRRACRAMPIETGARRLLFLRHSEFGVRTSAEEHGDGFHGGVFIAAVLVAEAFAAGASEATAFCLAGFSVAVIPATFASLYPVPPTSTLPHLP